MQSSRPRITCQSNGHLCHLTKHAFCGQSSHHWAGVFKYFACCSFVPDADLPRLGFLSRYHNTKFFATAQDPSTSGISPGLSANQKVVVLPANDGAAFADNLNVAWVPGNTLAIDFPFSSYATSMGHWLEVLLPIYRVLRSHDWAETCSAAGGGHGRIGAARCSPLWLTCLPPAFSLPAAGCVWGCQRCV